MLPNMLVIVTSLPHTLHELLAVCMSSNIIVKLTHLRDKLHVDVDVRTPVHCTDLGSWRELRLGGDRQWMQTRQGIGNEIGVARDVVNVKVKWS